MKTEPLISAINAAILSAIEVRTATLHAPTFNGKELAYLQECIESTYVSSVGAMVTDFEEAISRYTGAKYVVAVVNGTAALHLSLLANGVGAGDEVLIPALSFVATANAVSYCGATPHFVDVDLQRITVSAEFLDEYLESISTVNNGICINNATGSVIRAMIPMHTFGHPADLDGLQRVAQKYGLVMIEDAAESLGSWYKGRHTGTVGECGALSFNGNKIITTGGGGAVITDDENLAQKLKHLSTTAKIAHQWKYVHDEIGYNYRMPNVNAAIGKAQMEQLPGFISNKRELFNRYRQSFDGVDGVTLFAESPDSCSNYWLQTLLLDKSISDKRDQVIEGINLFGFHARPAWSLLNRMKPYALCPASDLKNSIELESRIINIPSSSSLI